MLKQKKEINSSVLSLNKNRTTDVLPSPLKQTGHYRHSQNIPLSKSHEKIFHFFSIHNLIFVCHYTKGVIWGKNNEKIFDSLYFCTMLNTDSVTEKTPSNKEPQLYFVYIYQVSIQKL